MTERYISEVNIDDPSEKNQCLNNKRGISPMETKDHSKRKQI